MASANPRGVQVSDVPTSLKVVVPADSAAIVAFGTAPIGSLSHNPDGTVIVWTTPGSGLTPYTQLVNKPIECLIPSDFSTQLGVSSNFGVTATGYTLSEVYDYAFVENSVSPVVAVNVFDPWSMSTSVSKTGLHVVNDEIAITGEVILPSLTVVGQSGHTYVQGINYSYAYNDTTLLTGTISVLTSDLASETSVNVFFYTPNLAAITASTIVGGTDVNGNNLGLAVLEDVYNSTLIVPCNIICPGFGHNTLVAAAANAHVQNISAGRFRATFVGSVDASAVTQYGQIPAWMSTNNFVSAFEIMAWPHVGLGGKTYHAETVLAVLMANTDSQYGNIPYVSPDNKNVAMDSTVLSSGKQILVNYTQAVAVEQAGVVTFVNEQGWHTLGGYTCAFGAGITDVVDFWINERRMFNWLSCTMTKNLSQFIGLPGNLRSLTTIENTIQAYLNTLVQAGVCWDARVSFNPNENLAAQVMSGIYVYHILWNPVTEIRTLDILLEFDVNGLTAAINGINIVSS